MRLFIAIPVPDHLRPQLQMGIDQAKTIGTDIKWVEEYNLHLTLKFLGEQPPEMVNKLLPLLKNISRTHQPIAVELTRVGFFPNRSRPRVIWMGIKGNIELLDRLAVSIDEQLQVLGMAPEPQRRWHLTLGRVRSDRNLDHLLPRLDKLFMSLDKATWLIDSFILYQSTLTPHGPLYNELGRFVLDVN